MSFPKKSRNFQSKSRNTIPNPPVMLADLNSRKLAAAIAQTLHFEFGETGRSIKTVMKHTGAGERTVKNWFQGKNSPNGENLVRLIHHSDKVLETLLLMAGREELLVGKMLIDARHKLIGIIEIIDQLYDRDVT